MTFHHIVEKIEYQIEGAVRRLLTEQDRDPFSVTFGCFDRRYWGWKLVDIPEATYQRNVHSLALLYNNPKSKYYRNPTIRSSIIAGLIYAAKIQHRDGSFDQAFPHEHSFGATAFLLHSLLEAFSLVDGDAENEEVLLIKRCLQRAANFLCKYNEEHGHIANHLAGASLSLLISADYFKQNRYRERADFILEQTLLHQSKEGWFLEYEGADPGYQTLCLYYLAQIYLRTPNRALKQALKKAIDFSAFFIHPDGTFSGEYAARRTTVFYPGGLALLSPEFPMAFSMIRSMCYSIYEGHPVTLQDIDVGNLGPLLSNYICLLQANVIEENMTSSTLPFEQEKVTQDFPEAGLHIRATENYYSVLGLSNGGVLKVFDKRRRLLIWDDGGYIGQMTDGTLITSQMTILNRARTISEKEINLTSGFYEILNSLPTPYNFLFLRFLNLTFMRDLRLGNAIKKKLIKLLVSGKRRYSMHLQRRVRFESNRIVVEDRLSKSPALKLKWLKFGQKFIGIHMASAKYFEGVQLHQNIKSFAVDVDRLNRRHYLEVQNCIEVHRA